ncbi:hypothetical protein OBB02_00405 [Candidatus Puniceispirillum sp.]|nr:hypothetical protein [Candidatus Puniceispirillum sp.]
MRDKHTVTDRDGAGRSAGKRLSGQKFANKRVKSGDPRQFAIRSLLDTAHANIDDKVATLKTAHYVDKDRFQSAFRRLMGTTKS